MDNLTKFKTEKEYGKAISNNPELLLTKYNLVYIGDTKKIFFNKKNNDGNIDDFKAKNISNDLSSMGWPGDDIRRVYKDCGPSYISVPQSDKNLVISDLHQMSRTVRYCPMVDYVNLMQRTFENNSTIISIPKFNTEDVWNMGACFRNCVSLISVPELNTKNVREMWGIFEGCKNLKRIPKLDTRNVQYLNGAFSGCSKITTIPYLETSNVFQMNSTFLNCTSLTELPKIDTQNVVNMGATFKNCTKLKSIPEFNMKSVEIMIRTFEGCTSLESVPKLTTPNVNVMFHAFADCTSLKKVPVMEAYKVTNMEGVFLNCTSLTDFGGFLELNTDIDFSSCINLSKESLMNIIEKSKSGVSGKTMTLGSINMAKLTEAEKTIAINKGWALVG